MKNRLFRKILPFFFKQECSAQLTEGVHSKTLSNISQFKGRPVSVLIEGNIGSGKTTFLQQFGKFSNVELVPEPVHKWTDVGGVNLLKLMYEDPERWSLAFQTYVQLTMLEQQVAESAQPVRVMERSIFSARHCFVENLYHSGRLAASEYQVLAAWFDYLTAGGGGGRLRLGADLIVYLRTRPEVAHERVRSRRRGEEHLISLEYLRQLHRLHEAWLVEAERPVPAPVLVVDANQSVEEMGRDFERCVSCISHLAAAGGGGGGAAVSSRFDMTEVGLGEAQILQTKNCDYLKS